MAALVALQSEAVGAPTFTERLLRLAVLVPAPLAQPALVFDSFLSWLIVGLILSLTRVLTGNIAVAVGLHAGWVVVLRMLQQATDSGSSRYSFWVGRFDGLLGYWLLPWGVFIAITLWLTRARWLPQRRRLFADRSWSLQNWLDQSG